MTLPDFSQKHIQVFPGARLSEVTTFRLGGPCPAVILCELQSQLNHVVREMSRSSLPFFLMGGGSNLLVADRGLDEYVVRYYSKNLMLQRFGSEIEVTCSGLMDDLAHYAVEEGLDGLTFGCGIPGTIGGAIAGNAGAFGRQIGDVVKAVCLMNRKGETHWEERANLGFAYRYSNLLERGEILVSARIQIKTGDPAILEKERAEILELRRQKHPDWHTTPTAGSFFKNIEPTSAAERRQAAGWFLEQAGAKDCKVGGAHVFDKHANIIVADPGCTAADVLDLSVKLATAVREKFGLELKREVRLVGF